MGLNVFVMKNVSLCCENHLFSGNVNRTHKVDMFKLYSIKHELLKSCRCLNHNKLTNQQQQQQQQQQQEKKKYQ